MTNPPNDVLRRLEERIVSLSEACDLADKGLGSMLWIINNRNNWADPCFDGFAEAAEEDARRAIEAIRSAR